MIITKTFLATTFLYFFIINKVNLANINNFSIVKNIQRDPGEPKYGNLICEIKFLLALMSV